MSGTKMIFRGPMIRLAITLRSGPDTEDWCRVQVTLDTATNRWSGIDPCLTGAEARKLAAWLDAAAAGAPVERLEFLEPELAFTLDSERAGWLRVELRYNLQPNWADLPPEQPFYVLLPAEPGQLQRAALSLRSELAL